MELDLQMWLTFTIIGGAMLLYISERVAMEITSLLVITLLIFLFHVFPQESLSPADLLAGFGNPALIAVMALLVMGQGLFYSGALEGLIELTTKSATRHPLRALGVAAFLVVICSGFLNNTPVVLMFIPVVAIIIKKGNLQRNMPMLTLSFVSILGGMTTLIGSSTNLLVADAAWRNAGITIGFFDQTLPGVFLALIGVLYIGLVMPFIMRRSEGVQAGGAVQNSGRQFIVEIRLRADDVLVGEASRAGFFPALSGVTVQMISGAHGKRLPPFDSYKLAIGDRLSIAATRKELADILATPDHPLNRHIRTYYRPLVFDNKDDMMLAEIVVAPGARFISRTIYQTGFAYETNCRILGVQRQSRFLRYDLSEIRLEAGDVLLIMGTQSNIESLRGNRDALLMEWSTEEILDFRHAMRARFIFGITILISALGIVPLVAATLAGASLMILSGVLNIRQAARGIDLRIFLLIGAALCMAQALSVTGGAAYLATHFLSLFDNTSPALILSAFFLLCACFTNILSNSATAVLFTPIALNLAQALNIDAMAFLFAVIFAANCSFATPMAYQTNLLVMNSGNLQFRDFARAGTPLIIIIWLAYSFFAPLYFGF